MSITNTASYSVADQATASASASVVVQPAAVVGTARGRLIHPTLGTYDYLNTPTDTVNVDAGVLYGPIWTHTPTLGGAVDAVWAAKLKDARVVERWANGDTGGPIAHLRALWSFYANPPDPASAWVLWYPNYCTAQGYKVAMVAVRAGGSDVTLNRRMLGQGYSTGAVELELRVIGLAS